jgi:ABC-2 type transport system ATP-binding protein
VTGFLGPNGSGKTTTLRILLGLATPTAGTATIGGLPYRQLPDPVRLQVRLVDGSTVEARSATADAVGVAAAAAGVTILELSRHDEDLESLFFDLVNQNPQNQEAAA